VSDKKLYTLRHYIEKLKHVAIAFSGGVDSMFLMRVAHSVLGQKAYAFTVRAPQMVQWEIDEAVSMAGKYGFNQVMIETGLPEGIEMNPDNRCYICKKYIFHLIADECEKRGIQYMLDGTTIDDQKDYRPGTRALEELQVKSPLKELGFSREDIQVYSKEMKLETRDKPPNACMLTRFQHNSLITNENLRNVEKVERYIMAFGISGVRVRIHDTLARIEVSREERIKLFDINIWDNLVKELKRIGFKYVTIDLEGYKTGSMNAGKAKNI
jgi:uncharacterized protein